MTKLNVPSLAVCLALAGAPAFAAAPLTISEKIDLPIAPSRVWNTVKDFDGLQNWHPAIASSVVNQGKPNVKGAIRTLTTKDGAKVIEELLNYNGKRMTYSYRMNDTPLPVVDFVATITVSKAGDGTAIQWTSHFKAKDNTNEEEARKMVQGFFKAGLDSLKAKLN